MFVSPSKDSEMEFGSEGSFSEDLGLSNSEVAKGGHRRTPSLGEFFSSSSKWIVDQIANKTPRFSSSSRTRITEASQGPHNEEDALSWLLPGSSSPQDLGEGDLGSDLFDALSESDFPDNNDNRYTLADNVFPSPLCGESDDDDAPEVPDPSASPNAYEWALRLSSSFKEKFSSWKLQLQHNVALLDRFILRGSSPGRAILVHSGDKNPELVNPALCIDLDFGEEEEEEEEEEGTFSYYTLTQRANAFWKESVIAGIPQKIEEVTRASGALYTESISEMQDENSTSTFDKIRSRSLLRAYKTFNEKSDSLLRILRQLVEQDIQPLVREAYEEAVRNSGPSIYNASRIPMRAAQNVKEKVSTLLDDLISNLETTEKEMDGALQQVLFVLRSKEEDKVKQEQQQQQKYSCLWQDIDSECFVNDMQTDKPSRKRPREAASRLVSTHTAFDEATMSKLFVQDVWEQFFSTGDDVSAQYLRLEFQLARAGLTFFEVKSDANCQFRAIAHQIYGTEDAHSIIRALLVREISNNPQRYQRFMGSHEQLQHYISLLSEEGQRGDCITLCAVANLYCVDIFIYCPILIDPLLLSCQTGPSQKALYLSYINDNHYQSLVVQNAIEELTKPLPRPSKKSKQASLLEKQLVDNLKLLQISALDFNLEALSSEMNLTGGEAPLVEPLQTEIQFQPSSISLPVPSSIIPMSPTESQIVRPEQQAAIRSPLRTSRTSPHSLLQICVARIANAVDYFTDLESILPEDLLQRLIKHLVATGKLTDFVLPRLLTPSFHALHVPKCKKLTDVGLNYVTAKCPHLKEVDISGCVNIRGDSLMGVGAACPHLQYLDLEGCTGIPASAIPEITKHCTELVSINVSGTYITDSALSQVLRHCTKLSRLQIRACTQITDAGLQGLGSQIQYLDLSECAITDRTIIRLASSCPELRSLKLSNCRITDASIEKLCRACPNLTSLFLNSCDSISDITVHILAQHCPALQALSLSFCKRITDNAFMKSSTQEQDFLNLHFLDLARCINITDEALKQIAVRCPNLRSLNLSSCEDITDQAIMLMIEHCSTLEDLDLSKCIQLSDLSINAIARTSRNLRRLCLYNCNKITDGSVAQLASSCHHLTILDLSSCENITDTALIHLSKGCPGLVSLSLEECQRITDLGIGSLAEGCQDLHTLRLAYCKGITDLSLQVLSEACPRITSIDLSYCLNLSLPGIQQAIERWNSLTMLSLRGNNNISQEALRHDSLQSLNLSWCKNLEDLSIASIAQGCPGLQNLDLSWCSKLEGNHIGDLSRFCSQLRSVNLKGCNRVPVIAIKSFASECKIKVYH